MIVLSAGDDPWSDWFRKDPERCWVSEPAAGGFVAVDATNRRREPQN
jgi:hypothetical protein